MRVIEQFVQGKTGDDSACEDVIAVMNDFIAVIDGATSRSGAKMAGLPPGRFAALTVAREIEGLPADIAMEDAFARFTAAVRRGTEEEARGDAEALSPLMRPSAAVLVYSRARREAWRVADSTLLVDGRAHCRSFPQEEAVAALRRALLVAHLEKGASVQSLREKDPMDEMLLSLWRDLRVFANNPIEPWGYGVVNGADIPAKYLERFPIGNAREIVLASDGYPDVSGTLAETEAALEKIIAEDPLMIRLRPQAKGVKAGALSFDDRSYVRFNP